MLQTSFSLNELTHGLEEVGWSLVLVCTTGVRLFSKGENCAFSCTSKICQFYFVQKLLRGLHLNCFWVIDKFKNVADYFFRKGTYTWFIISGMGSGICVHN